MSKTTRRTVLRGMLGGTSVALALPLLDCFLNDNGTALAAGRPLPVRFGTWFWGCGIHPEQWNPAKTGADYPLSRQLQPIAAVKDKITVLSGFNAILDGKPNAVHASGLWGLRSGTVPGGTGGMAGVDLPSVDVLIGDVIGNGTRFRSLEVTASGDPKHTYSRRNAASINPSEASPAGFYARIFGLDFQDPNAAGFKPDPKVMLRQSVLSAVKDSREKFARDLGASDRARLDDYFTSVRQLENQLDLQLQKPPPAEACVVPGKVQEAPLGMEIEACTTNHRLLAQLLAMALACNQTNVFNMVQMEAGSSLRRTGSSALHHTLTHEEPIDRETGYQSEVDYFIRRSMENWATFVQILASVREGDGTLLDNMLVLAHSDVSFAKVHDVLGIPAMLAGRAGGKLKPGLHINGNGDPITRIGLTCQQVMGVPVDKWGTQSMQTSKPIGEILV